MTMTVNEKILLVRIEQLEEWKNSLCIDTVTRQVFADHSFTTVKTGAMQGNYICERCERGK